MRLLVALLLGLTLGWVPAAAAAPVGDAPSSTSSTSVATEVPEAPDIIPAPNSGTEPEDAGDRGGALQTAVFVLILASVGVIGALVVRESRRKRAERGF